MRLQPSGQNVIDQQKQLYQPQRPLLETSSTSVDSAATGHASGVDWQEEVYQKIKTMKELYLPELHELYQKIAGKLQQVKSMSPKALSASVRDMGSVVSMVDRFVGSAPGNGSRAAVGEDLFGMTNCRLQVRNFMSHDRTNETRKMKRYTSAMPLNVVSSTSSINDSEISELESTATSSIKRCKLEAIHALKDEIREINQRLIDTVIDISEESSVVADVAEGDEGTIVKCSFSAVALSHHNCLIWFFFLGY
ncbi:mediator of RNA polymerase II transcription subunit 15a-like [Humulus lupulus]|uniref:mediator of RNA polymerase II transcription subunit 15a-like n=1 Tax=Humulus lupulus TaxID=3486 RepID=UPI002B40E082|nr:mediator of RNA polymerase II transcription subunit 15a-like [Humulus lupulus]